MRESQRERGEIKREKEERAQRRERGKREREKRLLLRPGQGPGRGPGGCFPSGIGGKRFCIDLKKITSKRIEKLQVFLFSKFWESMS